MWDVGHANLQERPQNEAIVAISPARWEASSLPRIKDVNSIEKHASITLANASSKNTTVSKNNKNAFWIPPKGV